MSIDIYERSTELLERLANNIYERSPKTDEPFFFSIQEVHIVESWLKEILTKQKALTD